MYTCICVLDDTQHIPKGKWKPWRKIPASHEHLVQWGRGGSFLSELKQARRKKTDSLDWGVCSSMNRKRKSELRIYFFLRIPSGGGSVTLTLTLVQHKLIRLPALSKVIKEAMNLSASPSFHPPHSSSPLCLSFPCSSPLSCFPYSILSF